MTVEIRITVDLFHYYWNDPLRGALWACFNANIKPTADAMNGWIDGSDSGRDGFRYTLPATATAATASVTVNFPDDINLSLRAFDVDGNDVFAEKTNDRRNGVVILDPDTWAAVNRDGDIAGVERLAHGVPFATAFNQMARDARDGRSNREVAAEDDAPEAVSADAMMTLIDLSQAGGSRRRVPLDESATGDVDAVEMMVLPIDAPADVRVTNIHSLCGLMFKLGTRADMATLLTIADLELTVSDADGPVKTFRLGNISDDAGRFVRTFFSELDQTLNYAQVTSAWESSIARRVYVQDAATVFGHRAYADGSVSYRRRRESVSSRTQLLLSEVVGLEIIPSENFDPVLAGGRSLTFEAQASYEVSLRIYRDHPMKQTRTIPSENDRPPSTEVSDLDKVLLKLTPNKEYEVAFWSEFERDPQAIAGADYYDADGVPLTLEWVGGFDLAWDKASRRDDQPTLLFHAAPSAEGPATILIDRGDAGTFEAPLVVACDEMGGEVYSWRYRLGSGTPRAKLDFHHLKLTDPANLPDDPREIVVGVLFKGDVGFDFAQSYTSIEGVVRSSIPAAPDGSEFDRSVAEEFLDDLRNHNALNVFMESPTERRRHLNSTVEFYPVHESPPGGETTEYTYHFRHQLPDTPDPAEMREGMPFSARPFYADMSRGVGAERILDFALEHTFGTQIDFPEIGGIPTITQVPPLVPPDVSGEADDPERRQFLTATFSAREDGEYLDLIFNTSLLHDVTVESIDKDRDRLGLHLAAWRSVMDLARAKAITLKGRFRRFNHHLLSDSKGSADLAQLLLPVGSWNDTVWDVTDDVATQAKIWLSAAPAGDETIVSVRLTRSSGPRIHRKCHIVEFAFAIRREDAMVPVESRSWTFTRDPEIVDGPLDLFDSNGLKVRQISPSSPEFELVDPQFRRFVRRIAERSASIEPSDQEKVEGKLLRRLLSDSRPLSKVSDTERLAGDWMVPEGAVATEGGPADLDILPLSFRPLSIDTYLGVQTEFVVYRLLNLMDDVVNCRPVSWAKTRDASAWRKHFAALVTGQPAGDNILSILGTVAKLLIPLPNLDDEKLNPRIEELVRTFRDNDSIIYKKSVERLTRNLLNKPSIYQDAKAFVYSRLSENDLTRAVSPDFFRYISDKFIRRLRDGEDLVDHDDMVAVEGLTDLAGTPSFGFFEMLGDDQYDNEYVYSAVNLETFEGSIERIEEDQDNIKYTARGDVAIKLKNGKIQIPAGAVKPGDVKGLVYLASRSPVRDPRLLLTAPIDRFNKDEPLAPGTPLDLENFLKGEIVEAQNTNTTSRGALDVANVVNAFQRSKRFDDFVLSFIFSVRGDEEIKQETWANGFNNDVFLFDLVFGDVNENDQDSTKLQTPIPDVKTFLDRLSTEADLGEDGFNSVLQRDLLTYLHSILVPGNPTTVSRHNATMMRPKEKNPTTIDLRLDPAPRNAVPTEAYLLRPRISLANGALPDATMFYLVVNVEVTVWQPVHGALRQARNVSLLEDPDPGRAFAPEFGRISNRASPKTSYITSHVQGLDVDDPATLDDVAYSPHQLVQQLLVASDRLPPASDPSTAWDRHDLTVTVYARQRNYAPAAHVSGSETDHDLSESRLGKFTRLVEVDAEDFEIVHGDWFDPNYKDFSVDFAWSSKSNNRIFLLSGRKVSIRGR